MYPMSVDICGICRESLVEDTKTLPCNHVFHAECIDAWTARVNQCPFCRCPVVVSRYIPSCVSSYVRPIRSEESVSTYNQRIFDAQVEIHQMFRDGTMPVYIARDLLEDTQLITNNDLVYGFLNNLWNSDDLEYIEEVYNLEWVSSMGDYTLPDTNLFEFFHTNVFIEFARNFELSDHVHRRFMDEVTDRSVRRRVIDVFSTWQSLSNEFITDYISELYLPEIEARADELMLTPETLALIQSQL